ncbi:MAG: peptidylprolyl isomerase [Saprospiraceae bacterium]|jgi:FKBP-type peptidyl-prolyl cis-trans isomerase SlyD|nr:peptidylprolyl isomerase [Saprospiraceae bacterium]
MLIEKHQVVSLHYKLTEDTASGELIEETYGAEPLTFIYGIGMMLPAFENHLESKVAGDGFAFTLEPGDAYGEYEEQAVVEIPISSFADAEGNIDRSKLLQGAPLTMHDHEGRTYNGVVAEPKIESIVVDFNHPMSGRTLHFAGEIVEVRPATASELDHGHVHPGGHDHD